MEYHNNTLCISHAELTDGIMTVPNLKYHVASGRIQQVQRACYGTPALYAVESLPVKYRAAVKRRYIYNEEQVRARAFIDTIVMDQVAAAYYEGVYIGAGRGLSHEKRMIYTNSASILNAIQAHLSAAAAEQKKVGKSRRVKMSAYWEQMAKYLPRIADVYPHDLPGNPRVLQKKYQQYVRGGQPNYEVLISGKFCNKNAAKAATPEQVAWITKFLSHHTNLDNVEISQYYTMLCQAYNTACEGLGWKPVTSETIRLWGIKYGWAVDAGRRGAKEYLNRYAMQVKRFAPTAPGLLWSLDGWTVELYYKKRTEGKRGGRTTYCNRMTVVVVLDPHNKYPIGYATGYQESPELIKAALRDAVNHTAELFGQRLRPVQIQSDNYQIKIMLPTYEIAEYVTPAQVGNAKAKPIEPYFRRLNHKYAKKCAGNWSGYGITARKESQPNLEWLNAHKGQIPDEEGVREQIRWIIESERALKREEYVAGFSKIPADRILPMSTESYLLNFGQETGYKNTLEGSGLNVRLLGERHIYDSFDLEFRKYAHLRWNIKYDPDNMQEVLAVSDEGDLRFILEEKHVQPMALADRRPGDAEELQRVRDFNKDLKRMVIEHDAQATEIVRESLLRHPDLNNPYITGVLTDSRGQNKDRKSQYRLEYTDITEETAYEESAGATGTISTRDLY